MQLIDPIIEFQHEIQQIRRDIHAHPELCYEEHRTSEVVANKLQEWGITVVKGLGVTGVVGIIKNGTSERSAYAPIWMRYRCKRLTALPIPPVMPEKCMLVAMMVILRCFSVRRTIYPSIKFSMAPSTSFFNRLKKVVVAREP